MVAREREKVEADYQSRKRAADTEHIKRNLRFSEAHYKALAEEVIRRHRRMIGITRESIFEILISKDVRITDTHVSAIREFLKQLRVGIEQSIESLPNIMRQKNAPIRLSEDPGIRYAIDNAISQEAVIEVEVQVGEIRRKREQAARRNRADIIERVSWLILAGIVSVITTLVTQYLTGGS
jgi:hypothetical protein